MFPRSCDFAARSSCSPGAVSSWSLVPVNMQRQVLAVLRQDCSEGVQVQFSDVGVVWCLRLSSPLEQRQVPKRSRVLGQGWYGLGVLQSRLLMCLWSYRDKFRLLSGGLRRPWKNYTFPSCSCSRHSHSDSGELLAPGRHSPQVYTRQSTVTFG